jgi:hypothetical protein
MKKVAKIGRPKLRPQDRLAVLRQVGFRTKEAAILDSAASRAGKKFNAWAREVLLVAARENRRSRLR